MWTQSKNTFAHLSKITYMQIYSRVQIGAFVHSLKSHLTGWIMIAHPSKITYMQIYSRVQIGACVHSLKSHLTGWIMNAI